MADEKITDMTEVTSGLSLDELIGMADDPGGSPLTRSLALSTIRDAFNLIQFIESKDASGDASLVFTGFDATKYDSYNFVLANVIPATDSVSFQIQTSSDGGIGYDEGASDYHTNRANRASNQSSDTWFTRGSTGATVIALEAVANVGSSAGEDGISGEIKVFGPHLAKRTIITHQVAYWNSAGNLELSIGGGARNEAAIVDAIRFRFASGNIESGTITMYGLRNS